MMRRLAGERTGVAAIEFALIAPVLVLLLLGTTTLFDYYHRSLALERATATISDFMSRQSEIDETFMTKRIMDSLNHLVAHPDGPVQLRVSSLIRTAAGFDTDWTYLSKPAPDFADRPVPMDQLPDISKGDSVLVTETSVPQKALFKVVGLGSTQHRYITAVRPRFSDKITWIK